MPRKRKEVADEPNGDGEPEVVESKADKFRRLANRRLFKAERALMAVANLGNASSYEYTDEQRDVVLGVLARMVEKVTEAFTPKTSRVNQPSVYV